MSIDICGYTFNGSFVSTALIRNQPGIYAILDRRSSDSSYGVDVGESARLRDRLDHHDRRNCWRRNTRGAIRYAVMYTPGMSAARRQAIESRLRAKYSPACGVR